jgi:hypothetical protein
MYVGAGFLRPFPVLSSRMLSRRLVLALSLLAMFALGVIVQQPPPKRPPQELLRLSLAAEKPGLAEPFTGVATNGPIESGLFPVHPAACRLPP